MQNRVFFAICLGFIFGVLLRSFVFVNIYFAILCAVLALVLLIVFKYFTKLKYFSAGRYYFLFFIFIISLCLGIFRFQMVDTQAPYVFESHVGSSVKVSGIVVDEPDIKEKNQRLLVEIKSGADKTKILVTTDFNQEFKYGDEITLEAMLEKPKNFITDQGKDFNYVNFLRKDGIFYVMNYPKINIVSRGYGNFVKSFLFDIKNKFLEKMNIAIPSPESLLMGGLILGEKSSFDQALRQSFVDTGTIHIVALSGYNVTIVAEWIMKVFYFLSRNVAIGLGIFSIILFILMTGASTTAIRAGIMAILALIARATGRNYDVARALILALVFMVLFNPFILVYDVSFQLSFIATVAVIFFAPRIEKYFLWITPKLGLRDIVNVTVAAYIFVMPFILYKMGNLSLVALPANILILPFIPLTMLLGFLTGFAGLISYFLALPLGYVSYLFLHYELGVISFFSHLPFASLTFSSFPLFATLTIYAYFIYKLFGRSISKFFTNYPRIIG